MWYELRSLVLRYAAAPCPCSGGLPTSSVGTPGKILLLNGDRPVEEFLRELFRERRLNVLELDERLRAVKDLGEGKLKPSFAGELTPTGRIVLRRRLGGTPLDPSCAP